MQHTCSFNELRTNPIWVNETAAELLSEELIDSTERPVIRHW